MASAFVSLKPVNGGYQVWLTVPDQGRRFLGTVMERPAGWVALPAGADEPLEPFFPRRRDAVVELVVPA